MKYIFLFFLALTIAVNANAQGDMQHTPSGVQYQVCTHIAGDKLKQNDIVTFNIIQKTDKDSVLFSTYAAGHTVATQVHPTQNVADLMDVFPLLTIKDSVLIKIPTDTMFKGHEEARPAFLKKGSFLITIVKIEKAQTLNDYMADIKANELKGMNKYIADHKLVLKTTLSGLRYVITKPSLKTKVQKGDTVLVNYTGRGTDDKIFDSSVEANAKAGGLNQPGRTYEPLEVVIGTSSIIQGWVEGLLLLNEGSQATLVIPSSLGYGAQGSGDIKPFSSLIFDIEVVKVKPAKHVAPVATATVAKKPLAKKKTTTKKK